jgi:matrix metalloproteinase-8 (neutrophil collagenase)
MAGTNVVEAIPCDAPWVLGDGTPTIAFDEKIPGTCSGSCLAATFVGFYDCDYYSLYEPCWSGKEWNIEAIMVHEVGHVLGLGHTDVSGATMYPSVSSCKSNPATIESDDAAGLGALYPP